MPHTHLSPSKSRRDLAGSLRGSRTRKHARLRHRLLQAERLEDRRMLAGDFEPSSLLPANGGDGSEGFVIPRVVPTWMSFATLSGAGDVNHDGIGDIVVAEPQAAPAGRTSAGQAWVIFGQDSFPPTFDLTSLNGTNGFTVYGKTGDYLGQWTQGTAGDVNGDNVDDLLMSAYSLDGPGGVRRCCQT